MKAKKRKLKERTEKEQKVYNIQCTVNRKYLQLKRCDFFTSNSADCISLFLFDQMVLQELVPPSSMNYEMQCSPKLPKALSELWRREHSCTCTTWTLVFTFRDRLEHCPGPLTGELGNELQLENVKGVSVLL